MKTLLRNFAVLLAGCALQVSAPLARAAAPVSPVGDWDFVMSGKRLGNAVITFSNNYTLGGIEILRPNPPKSSSPKSNPRGSGEGSVRGSIPSSTTTTNSSGTNATPANTSFIGGAIIDGAWTLDPKGKVLGYYREISQNASDGIMTTNGVSFRAVLNTAATRMTLQAYTQSGLTTLVGLRALDLPDIDVDFYGMGNKANQPFVDFFTLQQLAGMQNVYSITNGQGSDSGLRGAAILSRQKQIVILTITEAESAVLSVYVGPFKTNSLTGKLKGSDQTVNNIPYTVGPRF